jgi:lysophospholipase L1-like esterase
MAGGTFLDPLLALRSHPAKERRTFYFPGDGHLTKAGHEALARAIAPGLAALLPAARGT